MGREGQGATFLGEGGLTFLITYIFVIYILSDLLGVYVLHWGGGGGGVWGVQKFADMFATNIFLLMHSLSDDIEMVLKKSIFLCSPVLH